jgi:DNA processing protein
MLDPKDPGVREELRAWLAVQRALYLSPKDAVELLGQTSDPVQVLQLAGASKLLGDASLQDQIDQLARLDVHALPWTSALYPESLRVLPDAAPLLLVRGQPGALLGRAVAVVGARAATVYGVEVARQMGTALAQAGVVVVSGLARGIDAAAHRAALEAGGLTVAWSASGPDTLYPPDHRVLAEQIAESGAVVTEMPLGTPPLPHYFPLRNRLIAGLSEVVVVVEARYRSGSLSTARRALEQGREVMAVPGPIDAPTSRGPNRLLRDGARPVCNVSDVLDAMGLRGKRVRPGTEKLDPNCRRVLDCLQAGPTTRDELAHGVELDPGDLALALIDLELAGRVATDRDGRLRALGRVLDPGAAAGGGDKAGRG